MRIEIDNQLEHPFHSKVIIETDSEDIWSIGEDIKQALLGMGFHPDNVKELFSIDSSTPEEDKEDE